MISAVLDTNILASGTISAANAPGQILDAWHARKFELVTSAHIIDELTRTFKKPYFKNQLTNQAVNNFIDLLQNEAFITPIIVQVQGVATHPEDDLVISAAISGKVDYLVTGDQPMLSKVGSSYQGVTFTTPNEFLKVLQQGS